MKWRRVPIIGWVLDRVEILWYILTRGSHVLALAFALCAAGACARIYPPQVEPAVALDVIDPVVVEGRMQASEIWAVAVDPAKPLVIATTGTILRDWSGVGIIVKAPNVSLVDCRVTGNGAKDSVGIAVRKADNVRIIGCSVAGAGSTGISISDSAFARVIGCKVFGNGVYPIGDRGGIGGTRAHDILVERCTVWGNGVPTLTADAEICMVLCERPTIRDNTIMDAVHGGIAVMQRGSGFLIEGNWIEGFGSCLVLGGTSGKFSGINLGGPDSQIHGGLIEGNTVTRGAIPPGGGANAAVSCYSAGVTEITVRGNRLVGNACKAIQLGSKVDKATWTVGPNDE